MEGEQGVEQGRYGENGKDGAASSTQAGKEDERNQVEIEDCPNTFLPSLRLLTLFDSRFRWWDDLHEVMASVMKRRPYLRFDVDGETYDDGAKVDEAEMEIIDEFPVDGDTWSI